MYIDKCKLGQFTETTDFISPNIELIEHYTNIIRDAEYCIFIYMCEVIFDNTRSIQKRLYRLKGKGRLFI